ncbi:putative ribosomal protein L32p [Helianthus debilis subsp. tardiflorus]
MALSRISVLKTNHHFIFTFTRWVHAIAQSPPLAGSISPSAVTAPVVLPEFERSTDNVDNNDIGSGFYVGPGCMELMAVPKKKTSPHKRGIRNGPKALKPIPVIIRCKVCGRVKLPHFFCCSGLRDGDGQNGSTS